MSCCATLAFAETTGTAGDDAAARTYPFDIMPCGGSAVMQTQTMTVVDYQNVAKAIETQMASLDDSCDIEVCPQAEYAGCVLRMAGHDFMDYDPKQETSGDTGSNGCQDLAHPDNKGLEQCLADPYFGASIKQAYQQFCESISLADFLVISAEAVMTVKRNQRVVGGRIRQVDGHKDAAELYFMNNFKFGRKTAKSCKGSGDLLPDAERKNCAQVNDTFINAMGLSPRLSAALMGVHTLGRTRKNNSGYDGWWSTPKNQRLFNNDYYASLVTQSWMQEFKVGGREDRTQWRVFAGAEENKKHEMMLNSDMCLLYEEYTLETRGFPIPAVHCCGWLDIYSIPILHDGILHHTIGDGSWCGLKDFPRQVERREYCCPTNSRDCISKSGLNSPLGTGSFVLEFAANESSWLDAFLEAWRKATTNGYTDAELKPLVVTTTTVPLPSTTSTSSNDDDCHSIENNHGCEDAHCANCVHGEQFWPCNLHPPCCGGDGCQLTYVHDDKILEGTSLKFAAKDIRSVSKQTPVRDPTSLVAGVALCGASLFSVLAWKKLRNRLTEPLDTMQPEE